MIGYFESWDVLSVAGASYQEIKKDKKRFRRQYAQGYMTFRGQEYLISVAHLSSGEMLVLKICDQYGKHQKESECRINSILDIIFQSDETLKDYWKQYNRNYGITLLIYFVLLCTQIVCFIATLKFHNLQQSALFLIVSFLIFIIQKFNLIKVPRFRS
ncbi:MAG: hypothetical protein IJN92_10150 [Lachnospiraceae bacterium]|nr:hypothetical protein [Lachnospiraceae bacterium]